MVGVVSLLEIMYSLEKWFDAIMPLAERHTVFGVQVDFLEVRYTRLSWNFLDILKTHIDQVPIIHYASCFRYT